MTEVKSRREMYSEATRAALLEEATTLFAERGYSGTSLEDVASANNVVASSSSAALVASEYISRRLLTSVIR